MRNQNLYLTELSRELCHRFYQNLVQDPDLFADMTQFSPYRYDPQKVDAWYQNRQGQKDRKHFYIMLDDQVIGEVGFKHMNPVEKSCELTICMVNDGYKNRGYGTQAETLALKYAFAKLGMETVLADALIKNTRSQHVLEKVGFTCIGQDEMFRYYRCSKFTEK